MNCKLCNAKPGACDCPPVGPTGKYPRGKLAAHDRGELKAVIRAKEGLVEIAFGTQVEWMALSPAEARDWATSILVHASKAERQTQ